VDFSKIETEDLLSLQKAGIPDLHRSCRRIDRCGAEAEAKRSNDLQYRGELRVTFPAQCLVERLPGQAGILSGLGHTVPRCTK